MKIILLALFSLSFSFSSFAAARFTCTTETQENYYTKKTISVRFTNPQSVFVVLYDADAGAWNNGSKGTFVKKDQTTGWSSYTGFDSTDLFGDLSEGAADKGIYLYVSPEILAGKNGSVSLFAKGTEIGLQKATYTCKIKGL